jgi:hypothetical protein
MEQKIHNIKNINFDIKLDGQGSSNIWLITFNWWLMNTTRCRNSLINYWIHLTTILKVINRNFQVHIWTHKIMDNECHIFEHPKIVLYINTIWMINEYVYLNTWKSVVNDNSNSCIIVFGWWLMSCVTLL